MTGTIINIGTIIGGSLAGLSIGSRLPDRVRETVLYGLGLVTFLVGLQMALETKNILIVLGAILMGGIVGEILRLHDALQALGNTLQSTLSGGKGKSPRSTFAEGFITATLVFCVGPMAILGSLQDGLTGDYRTLAVKATLDGFASVAFAASLGWGVALSAVPILLYQGAITLFAGLLQTLLTEPMITEMTAAGGLMIVGISLKLLDLKEIRLANFLPSLVIAPLIVALIPWVKSLWP